MWGATLKCPTHSPSSSCFNPRPPCGGRPTVAIAKLPSSCFNPRPPCGGRPERLPYLRQQGVSIRAPRVGGDRDYRQGYFVFKVSIRAPRVGGDRARLERRRFCLCFNPRPPCGGRPAESYLPYADGCFNPRPPCGGRQRGLYLIDDQASTRSFARTRPHARSRGLPSFVLSFQRTEDQGLHSSAKVFKFLCALGVRAGTQPTQTIIGPSISNDPLIP